MEQKIDINKIRDVHQEMIKENDKLTEFEKAYIELSYNLKPDEIDDDNKKNLFIVKERVNKLLSIARKQIALEIDINGMVNHKKTWDDKAKKYYRRGIEATRNLIEGK